MILPVKNMPKPLSGREKYTLMCSAHLFFTNFPSAQHQKCNIHLLPNFSKIYSSKSLYWTYSMQLMHPLCTSKHAASPILGCPNMRPPGLIFGHQVVRSWSCSINLCLEDLQKKDHLKIPSNPSERFPRSLWDDEHIEKHVQLEVVMNTTFSQIKSSKIAALQSFYHHEQTHKQTN